VPVQCGRGAAGSGEYLYRNNGDGTFTDVSKAAKVDDPSGYYGLGSHVTDFDDDDGRTFWSQTTHPELRLSQHRMALYRDGIYTGVRVNENGSSKEAGISIGIYRDGDSRRGD